MASRRSPLASTPALSPRDPAKDCPLCPRLVAFRREAEIRLPGAHNAPVPSFGSTDARLLIVGLAPGLNGANRTGRPFTGDYAGDLLYATLKKFKFAKGTYRADPHDGLTLIDCMITNAVRCVPPENKPTGAEIGTCRAFLTTTVTTMPRLKAIIALGRIAHESTLRALGASLSQHPFGHAAEHRIGSFALFDSYHCSRYNTNTGRLTAPMFEQVFALARAAIDA
jgi:uracil-DNA glycosylase